MSPAFLTAVETTFRKAALTVDWFHVVQILTKTLDEVRRLEAKELKLPRGTRWAVLKGMETWRSEEQVAALKKLEERGLATATAFRVKELLRWVRKADIRQGARWRATRFFEFARELAEGSVLLAPIRKALNMLEDHLPRILRRWDSVLSNARLEGLNGLFQAARSRARGYRNVTTFTTMTYLIGAPITQLLQA